MRPLVKFVLVAATSTALASEIAQGRQLVVSQGPGADDKNSGTEEQPLRTISAAAAQVRPGDRVIIHAGQYREAVIIKTSGTPAAPIVFEAAAGETVVIKGSEVITGWTRAEPNVWVAKLPPFPRRSDNKQDPSFWQTNDIRQVFIRDGLLVDAVRLRPAASAHLESGEFFCDPAAAQLYIYLEDSEDPNTFLIEASVRTTWVQVVSSNVTIRRLQMRHCSWVAPAMGVGCNFVGQNNVLEDCTVSWSGYVGVGLSGKNNALRSCTIACHGNSGINGGGEAHLIDGCRIIYNNVDRYYFDWHAGGAKLIPKFNHGRIVHNEFAYNIGTGLWLDGASNDNLLEANVSHDNEGAGIQVEISAGNRLFNNISTGNRNPLIADYLEPVDLTGTGTGPPVLHTVRRGGAGLLQPQYHAGDGRGIYISSSPNTKVYHNTCYLNEGEGICVEGPTRDGAGVKMSTRDSSVRNNLCAYNKGTQLVIRRNGADKDTSGNASDYNMVMTLGAFLCEAGWAQPFIMKLADWQKTGNDLHSVEGDPSFAMAAMGDFRPLGISPATGAGHRIDGVETDFFGITRPDTQVTLGACETATSDYPKSAVEFVIQHAHKNGH